ncbi:trimethylamine---corrinoid protein Co-methyltransferase [Desulfacinum hydrothermale DSM 13146]|uniref:Trimethylamine---corrinoid protein Co-methyltransferase n=1 Tax=Desulfacinum hydrothermale DSM 13146 TaxID=1121390 RepID=A0A1W1X8T2_9BACT|nr:trimethylamine methyltransferase family protein [Desulfacinum hydrothermale]SMC20273.1 trimethylamine---corrinoid protein Co-methyltransferase [Desulfacinum hydrothermale DSM 13146]
MMKSGEYQPRLQFLDQEQKKRIHQEALQVLESVGMEVLQEEARSLLIQAGAREGEGNRLYIPASLVDKALETAPNNIAVYDREGTHVMDLGGRRAYFGTGSDLIYNLDPQSEERHPCRLEDVTRAARLCDALPNIDFVMSFAHPSEIPPHFAYLKSFEAMALSCRKPIVCTAEDRGDLEAMWKIGCAVRGGAEALRQKPYLIHYAEPISPLKHPVPSLNKLLLCAEKEIPAIYSPAPIAGSTAPMTLAGHVVQGLAECLTGLIIHQLKRPGAPFLMGMGPAVLDMATGQCSYNAPEYYMAYGAMIEMSHFYDLPSWGYAGTSDSQVPDGQATFEAGLLTFLSTFLGANLNHDVGYLDFGRTGALEMIVMVDEFIDQIRRMALGIPTDPEHLGVDAIAQVGPGGHFLTHPHTLKHLRDTQWRPRLIHRGSHEKWTAAGKTTLLDRSRARVREILEKHLPVPVPDPVRQAIQEIIDTFQEKGHEI